MPDKVEVYYDINKCLMWKCIMEVSDNGIGQLRISRSSLLVKLYFLTATPWSVFLELTNVSASTTTTTTEYLFYQWEIPLLRTASTVETKMFGSFKKTDHSFVARIYNLSKVNVKLVYILFLFLVYIVKYI